MQCTITHLMTESEFQATAVKYLFQRLHKLSIALCDSHREEEVHTHIFISLDKFNDASHLSLVV